MTALQLAREMGHAACVRALKEHAATAEAAAAEAEVKAAQEAEAAAAEAQQVDRCATMTRRAWQRRTYKSTRIRPILALGGIPPMTTP
mmetsp:Transcript_43170/g.138651  ORF Transcript_43170/g.138651 Transcript_43170/m.138651 type:complete len:88 (-) Transcript_43170:395-658(-)